MYSNNELTSVIYEDSLLYIVIEPNVTFRAREIYIEFNPVKRRLFWSWGCFHICTECPRVRIISLTTNEGEWTEPASEPTVVIINYQGELSLGWSLGVDLCPLLKG